VVKSGRVQISAVISEGEPPKQIQRFTWCRTRRWWKCSRDRRNSHSA
jgi:hypothetical protein